MVGWLSHFETRRLEWCIALYTVYFGAMLMLPPESMAATDFIYVLFIMDEFWWGVCYALIGAGNCLALHINGRAAWTPFARFFAIFMNAQIFLAMGLAMGRTFLWGAGTLTYLAIAFLFCGVALRSAATDCGRELSIMRRRRECEKRGRKCKSR